MILDLIFIVFVVLLAYFGAKKGLFGAISRILSTVIALIFAIIFGDSVKEALAKTEQYQSILNKMTEKIAEKLSVNSDSGIFEPFMSSVSENIAEGIALKLSGIIVSILVFVLVFICVKLIIKLLNGVFKLPVLRSANKFGGFVWGALEALIITYIVIGVLGGVSLLNTNDFMARQLAQSVIIRAMYENNLVIKLFA